MNDRDDIDSDNDIGIDHDRTEGSLKQAGGKLKEGAGKLFGDSKMETEGKADQGEGKLQNAWGGLKDSVRDAVRGDNDDDI
jgi:uncharacterized protein YjbJ (UPF0337 family)